MLDPISILAAISAANGAFSTITTAAKNTTQVLQLASKFLSAKAAVDAQAKIDEGNKKTSTEAFVASIELKRKQKELDEFFAYECEGWVAAEWRKHKKAIEDEAWHAAQTAKMKRNKKPADDDDIKYMFIALGIVAIIMGGIISLIKGKF